MSIGPVSLIECLIVLVLLVIVAALAFRVGFFRGRGR
jgi:Tfp pilus assembly protein FimT